MIRTSSVLCNSNTFSMYCLYVLIILLRFTFNLLQLHTQLWKLFTIRKNQSQYDLRLWARFSTLMKNARYANYPVVEINVAILAYLQHRSLNSSKVHPVGNLNVGNATWGIVTFEILRIYKDYIFMIRFAMIIWYELKCIGSGNYQITESDVVLIVCLITLIVQEIKADRKKAALLFLTCISYDFVSLIN